MPIKLDETDAKIIELLQKDGRMMYKDVAWQLGISLPTVRTRLRKLLSRGIIKKFTIVVDPEKIYGKARAFFVIDAKAADLGTIAKKLSEIKGVREVFVTTGSFGAIAKVEVDNVAELDELVTKRLNEIPEIMNAKSSVIVKTVKEEYGISAQPYAVIQFKCAFCGGIVVQEPYVDNVNGEKFYFHTKDCADAFKERLAKR